MDFKKLIGPPGSKVYFFDGNLLASVMVEKYKILTEEDLESPTSIHLNVGDQTCLVRFDKDFYLENEQVFVSVHHLYPTYAAAAFMREKAVAKDNADFAKNVSPEKRQECGRRHQSDDENSASEITSPPPPLHAGTEVPEGTMVYLPAKGSVIGMPVETCFRATARDVVHAQNLYDIGLGDLVYKVTFPERLGFPDETQVMPAGYFFTSYAAACEEVERRTKSAPIISHKSPDAEAHCGQEFLNLYEPDRAADLGPVLTDSRVYVCFPDRSIVPGRLLDVREVTVKDIKTYSSMVNAGDRAGLVEFSPQLTDNGTGFMPLSHIRRSYREAVKAGEAIYGATPAPEVDNAVRQLCGSNMDFRNTPGPSADDDEDDRLPVVNFAALKPG